MPSTPTKPSKPTVQEILAEGHRQASDNGAHIAQVFPADKTPGHFYRQLFDNFTDNQIVEEHLRQRKETTKSGEGVSAYLQSRVFYTAADVTSGALDYVPMTTCFANRQQARDFQDSLVPATTIIDSTLPKTAEQERKLVHTLFQAFKSIALAEDNVKYLDPWKRQEHDNKAVEVMCWSLLEKIIERCNLDGSLQHKWWVNNPKQETYEYKTFAERYDSVVYNLARSKSSCRALLDAPQTCKLADDPMARKDKTDNNRRVNHMKSVYMQKGRPIVEASGGVKRKRAAPGTATKKKRKVAAPSVDCDGEGDTTQDAEESSPSRSSASRSIMPSSDERALSFSPHRPAYRQSPFVNPASLFSSPPTQVALPPKVSSMADPG